MLRLNNLNQRFADPSSDTLSVYHGLEVDNACLLGPFPVICRFTTQSWGAHVFMMPNEGPVYLPRTLYRIKEYTRRIYEILLYHLENGGS